MDHDGEDVGRHPEQEQPATGLRSSRASPRCWTEPLGRRGDPASEPLALWCFGETIHEYARERLEGAARPRDKEGAAEHFLALAEAEPELSGADQLASLERLEAEHDNMRAALTWSLENEPETVMRLARALARFWSAHFSEGSRWLEAAVQQSGRVDAAARAKLSSEAGTFAFYRADFDRAIVLHGRRWSSTEKWGTITVLPSHCCAWGLNIAKRVTTSAQRSWRRRWGLSQKWEQAEHRRHPSKPRGGGAPEGATTSGRRRWAWRVYPWRARWRTSGF